MTVYLHVKLHGLFETLKVKVALWHLTQLNSIKPASLEANDKQGAQH